MKTGIRRKGKHRHGFSLVELFVLVAIILALIAMALPAMRRSSHGAASRSVCANKLRQLAIAMHNYHDAYKKLPAAMGRLDLAVPGTHEGADRLSGLVQLLPYIEEVNLYEEITTPTRGDKYYPAGPAPWDSSYPAWQRQVELFLCPEALKSESEFGQTSYGFCIGDTARNIHNSDAARGAFAPGISVTLEEISVADGTSNTIAMGEIGSSLKRHPARFFATGQPVSILEDPSSCLSLLDSSPANQKYYKDSIKLNRIGRGGCWADGAAGYSLFNTILPPGSPSASLVSSPASDGIFSAGGYHAGGTLINIVFADASIHTIQSTIDAGDSNAPVPSLGEFKKKGHTSPYGVWGALGSFNGGEVTIDNF